MTLEIIFITSLGNCNKTHGKIKYLRASFQLQAKTSIHHNIVIAIFAMYLSS